MSVIVSNGIEAPVPFPSTLLWPTISKHLYIFEYVLWDVSIMNSTAVPYRIFHFQEQFYEKVL